MDAKTAKIRELNDRLRTTFFAGGMVCETPGFRSLTPEEQSTIREKIETFNDFTEDNDPHGEHDFGIVKHNGHKVFWKIDYYDHDTKEGSEDPSDPLKTLRLLTIMLADEY